MKKFLNSLILSFLSAGSLTAGAADFKNQLNGVQLKSCNQTNTKCLELKLKQADMSQFAQLFAFADYQMTFTSKKSNQILTGHFGYFDLDQNKVVIRLENPSREILIDLKTLNQQEFAL